MAELLGVAASAGIDVEARKQERTNFMPDENDDFDDDEELDLSVSWDDDEDDSNNANVVVETSDIPSSGESITRMDEDTGASGVW